MANNPDRYIVTYAPAREDITVSSLVGDATGVYIDIGADHPVYGSKTKFFYDRGHRGYDIALTKHSETLFRRGRDGDMVAIAEDRKRVSELFEEWQEASVFCVFIAADKESVAIADMIDWSVVRPTVIAMEAGGHSSRLERAVQRGQYRIVLDDGKTKYFLCQAKYDHSKVRFDAIHDPLVVHHQVVLNIRSLRSKVADLRSVISVQSDILDSEREVTIDDVRFRRLLVLMLKKIDASIQGLLLPAVHRDHITPEPQGKLTASPDPLLFSWQSITRQYGRPLPGRWHPRRIAYALYSRAKRFVRHTIKGIRRA